MVRAQDSCYRVRVQYSGQGPAGLYDRVQDSSQGVMGVNGNSVRQQLGHSKIKTHNKV